MAEDSRKKKRHKNLEALLKYVLWSTSGNLVKKRFPELKEEEKKKHRDAKIEDRPLVVTNHMLKNNAAGQTSVQTLPTMNQKSTSVKKDNRKKETLKVLEYLGKDMLHGVFNYLAKHNVLTLKEEEKKKYYDAKIEDKALILVDSMRKNRVAHQRFTQTLLNMDQRITSIKQINITFHKGIDQNYSEANLSKREVLLPHIIKYELDGVGCSSSLETRCPELCQNLIQIFVPLTLDTDMESALRAFAARPEHKSSDSTFLVLMSHGILEGICGTAHDEKNPDVLLYDTVFQIFNNRNCLSLKDKPKVIIVQACRGERRGEHWVRDSPAPSAVISSQSPENLEEDSVCRVHVEKDFIAFCSSTPHNVSWRDRTRGSIFITELITCFQKYSWCYHLMKIFQKVQKSFEIPKDKAQMPTIERVSLTRDFYLFPGN
ncbi:PREDICTED: caspase-5 [Rhinopithecus bieti]|uniref:caspase-5 n=1 Tax=Rhinopithecus bieti TaxID=61621 RepID=UPI00083C8ACF|nr:PREDICTED: caspase-5 [Rhinopithecus bieti]